MNNTNDNRADLSGKRLLSSQAESSPFPTTFLATLQARLKTAVAQGLVTRPVATRVLLLACLAGADWRRVEQQPLASWISGEELGQLVGLSRAAVHKHIEKLRAAGFAVAPAAGAGYRLALPFGDLLVPEAVLYYLLAGDSLCGTEASALADWDLPALGLPYHYLRECSSTNLVLKERAASSVAGTTVAADSQTAGKGRVGRRWVSEPCKDLAFSVLVRPRVAPSDAPLLSIAAALAVTETVENLVGPGISVGIKWPNDVMVDGKKVCGILLEAAMEMDQVQWAIVGIGVNVNSEPGALRRILAEARPDEWRGRPEPISLLTLLGRPVPRAELLVQLLGRLAVCLALAEEPERRGVLLEKVRRRDVLRGRRIKVTFGERPEESLEGKAEGLGRGGQLKVRASSGATFMVSAGDVLLLEES